jgi:hypothetical protein
MASLGQYQSFALIAYDAIRRQADNVACCRNNGDNVSTQMSLLYTAKKLADVVLSYSTSSLSFDAVTENDIIAVCNWLSTNLFFSSTTIPSLASTTLNLGGYDFNQQDFNNIDFA